MTPHLLRGPLAAIAIALVCASPRLQAQTQAPGLWEHSMTMNSPGGEAEIAMAAAQQKLASLPPEQRQQIEQMMARNGVKISPGGTTTVRACITKEAAARTTVQLPGDCQQSGVVRKGNTMSFKYACTKPQPSSGEGEITFAGDKSYTGHSTVNAQVAGRSQQLNIDLSGKWIAADCGNVKPMAVPAAQ